MTVDSLVVASTEVSYSASAHANLIAIGVLTEAGPLRHVSKVQVRDADDRIVADAIVTHALPGSPIAD